MSKFTPRSIGQVTASQATLNVNFDDIAEAFDNTLSRDGTSPNEMGSSIDMDSNRIYNLGTPESVNDAARLQDIEDAVEGATFGIIEPAAASLSEAQAGVVNNKFMTPLRSEQHSQAFLNRGLDAEQTDYPTTVLGGFVGGQGQPLVGHTFELETTDVPVVAPGEFLNTATVAILRKGAGFSYPGGTSAGKSDIGLFIQSERQNWETDEELGQVGGVTVRIFMPKLGDGGAYGFAIRRSYRTGGVNQTTPATGATSGLEGNIRLDDINGDELFSIGVLVGSVPPYDSASVFWAKQGIAFRAQAESDAGGAEGCYAAFLSEERSGSSGFTYLFAGHTLSNAEPYFEITGERHADGPGLVRITGGTAALPSLSFHNRENQGLYTIGPTSFGASTEGVLRVTIATAGVTSTVPVSDPVGRLQAIPRTTTEALAAISDAINTTEKFLGKTVINITTGVLLFAAGATAGSVWRKLDNTTAHTPV